MKFLNQNGVALAQAMVVAGFVGLFSLSVANLSNQMGKNLKDAEVREEKIFLTGEITGILGDTSACTNSFAGLDAAKDKATEVKDSAGTTRFEKGISYGNQNLEIVNFKLDDSSDQVGLLSPGAGLLFLP